MAAGSGGWTPADPVGDRRFLDLEGAVRLERGGTLPAVRVAYESWGTLAPDAGNAVLVEHALTGDSHVVGAAGGLPRRPRARPVAGGLRARRADGRHGSR